MFCWCGPRSPSCGPRCGTARPSWPRRRYSTRAARSSTRPRPSNRPFGLPAWLPRGGLVAMGQLLVGTASWTDKKLLASGWYPESANTAEKRLQYYARKFPLVEVDATSYSPPAEATARLWAQRSPADFLFNIKAFSLLTGHPTKVSAIYKDLRPETEKTNIYPDDLTPQAYEDVWTRFLSALDPLVEAGKLGALLFQFPPWFTIRRANKQYPLEGAKRGGPLRVDRKRGV